MVNRATVSLRVIYYLSGYDPFPLSFLPLGTSTGIRLSLSLSLAKTLHLTEDYTGGEPGSISAWKNRETILTFTAIKKRIENNLHPLL